VYFGSVSAFLLLLQCGLGPVLTRNIARIYAPLRSDTPSKEAEQLLSSANSLLKIITIAILGCSVIAYYFVLSPVASNGNLYSSEINSWWIYTIGLLVNVISIRDAAVLNGCGHVGIDKAIRIVSSIAFLALTIILLEIENDLRVVAIAYLVTNLLAYVLQNTYLRRHVYRGWWRRTGYVADAPASALIKEGLPILITNISGIVVGNIGFIVVARYCGIEAMPAYSAAAKVAALIVSISILVPQMAFPLIASNWERGKREHATKLYLMSVGGSVGIVLFSALTVVVLEKQIVYTWLGEGMYYRGLFTGFMAYCVMYVHHVAHASAFLATTGRSMPNLAILNAITSIPIVAVLVHTQGISGSGWGMLLATLVPSIGVVVITLKHFAFDLKNLANKALQNL
jgi:O-antigen/teichoic acid export membrane protein